MIKKIIALLISLTFLLSLTACSSKQDTTLEDKNLTESANDKSSEDNEESKGNEESEDAVENTLAQEDENLEKVKQVYTSVLDNMNPEKFNPDTKDDGFNCTYTYSLVKLNNLDYPLLLVYQDYDYGMSDIKFYYPNKDFTKELSSDEIVPIGVARAGGFRGDINLSESKDTLSYVCVSSGTGDSSIDDISFELGDENLNVQIKSVWEGSFDDMPESSSSPIDLSDISDRIAIDNISTSN
ncbi:hypothetical protein C3V37_04065 [Peptostreptococcaceae bacterium oral taxon 929]|nr:hypothetical protein C3V37_04065 [Peptostreptococcaceae bacterium oral taxon 929]